MPAEQKKKTPIGVHLLAGGGAGMAEALACHPLDTIKVRPPLPSSEGVSVAPYSLFLPASGGADPVPSFFLLHRYGCSSLAVANEQA